MYISVFILNDFWSFIHCRLSSSKAQKGKQGTKGAKQIVEENAGTLKFYQYMAAGSTTIFFIMNFLFFEFTATVSVSINEIFMSISFVHLASILFYSYRQWHSFP